MGVLSVERSELFRFLLRFLQLLRFCSTSYRSAFSISLTSGDGNAAVVLGVEDLSPKAKESL